MRSHPNKTLLQEIEDATASKARFEMKDFNHKKP